MSLLDAYKKANAGFDAKKGKIAGSYEKLPDGTYTVGLRAVNHGFSKTSNYEYLMFSLEVLEGEHSGSRENIQTPLDSKKPQFVITKSIQTIEAIGAMVGLDDLSYCFNDDNVSNVYEMIQNAFDPYLGKALTVTIEERPNYKKPEYPYRNYEFGMAEQPKVAEVTTNPFENNETATTQDQPILPADNATQPESQPANPFTEEEFTEITTADGKKVKIKKSDFPF